MKSMLLTPVQVCLSLLLCCSAPQVQAQHVNPNQAEIDALNDEKALLEARSALDKAKATGIKERFPGFDKDFGKEGALIIESAERDKFHVTARAADAFLIAAQKLAAIHSEVPGKSVLLTNLDRSAVPTYWRENRRLIKIATEVRDLLGPKVTPEALPAAGILSVGSMLSELAQFTKLVRGDKSIAFAVTDLPDEILLDALTVAAKGSVLYPASTLDALLDGSYPTEFGKILLDVTKRRSELLTAPGAKQARAKAVLAELDAMAADLSAADTLTQAPLLMTVLRGEVVNRDLISTNGQVFAIKIVAKGGTSLKDSRIWRSDRPYAAGGVVTAYRITTGGTSPTILRAGVVTQETAFQQIPLN